MAHLAPTHYQYFLLFSLSNVPPASLMKAAINCILLKIGWLCGELRVPPTLIRAFPEVFIRLFRRNFRLLLSFYMYLPFSSCMPYKERNIWILCRLFPFTAFEKNPSGDTSTNDDSGRFLPLLLRRWLLAPTD